MNTPTTNGTLYVPPPGPLPSFEDMGITTTSQRQVLDHVLAVAGHRLRETRPSPETVTEEDLHAALVHGFEHTASLYQELYDGTTRRAKAARTYIAEQTCARVRAKLDAETAAAPSTDNA